MNNNTTVTATAASATTINSQGSREYHLDTSYQTKRSNTRNYVCRATYKTMIQVVDDEFDIVNVTKFFLQDIGLNVFGFTDPLLALKHFHINYKKYRLVISDIGMPRMNGYEFVKQVKKINPKVKVILMSAFQFEDNEFLNMLPDLMIDAFVQKPFSNSQLEDIIEGCLSISEIH